MGVELVVAHTLGYEIDDVPIREPHVGSSVDDRTVDFRPEHASGHGVVDLNSGRLFDHVIDARVAESGPRGQGSLARQPSVDEVRGRWIVGGPCSERHLELVLGIVEGPKGHGSDAAAVPDLVEQVDHIGPHVLSLGPVLGGILEYDAHAGRTRASNDRSSFLDPRARSGPDPFPSRSGFRGERAIRFVPGEILWDLLTRGSHGSFAAEDLHDPIPIDHQIHRPSHLGFIEGR